MLSKNFSEMSPAEAQAFFDAYVAAGPDRIDWLGDKTGLSLERAPETLVELWSWFLEWARSGGGEEPVEGLPMWCFPPSPGDPEPLVWDDDRPRDVFRPRPLPPAVLWLVDAASYFLVEVIQTAVPRLHYRLYREDKRSILFHCPVITTGDPGFIEQAPPLTRKWCHFALAPGSDWEAQARQPETLLHRFEHYVEQAEQAASKPPSKTGPPQTGAELLERHRESRLWDVELVEEDEEGELQVSFDDEVAHLASAAIDGLVEDLTAARPRGVADVYRMDRDIVVIEGRGDPETLDRARIEALVDERMTERLGGLKELRVD